MSDLEAAALGWWHHWRESIFHPMSPEMMAYYNDPATRRLVSACADKAAEPNVDGRTAPGEGDAMGAAIQAATAALVAATKPTADDDACLADEQACFVAHPIHFAWYQAGQTGVLGEASRIAEAAVRAAAPILHQAIAEEIARVFEALAAGSPAADLQCVYAAQIVREIGAKP